LKKISSAATKGCVPGKNLSVVHTKLTHVICKRHSQPLYGARRDFKRDEAGRQVSKGDDLDDGHGDGDDEHGTELHQ